MRQSLDRTNGSEHSILPGRRIRLLLVLEATTGGTRRHLDYLISHLNPDRFAVSLAYSDTRDKHFSMDLARFSAKGVVLHRIPMKRNVSPWSDSLALWKLTAVMRRGKYDLVHAHSSKAGFLARIAAFIAGVPNVVYSPHSFAFQANSGSARAKASLVLEKIGARFQAALICVSEGERRLALKHRLVSDSRLAVLPNTVPRNELKPTKSLTKMKACLGSPDRTFVVGTVAQLRPQKGIGCLINAIPSVLESQPQTMFLIVGDGPLLRDYQNRVRDLNVTGSVVFAGHREDIANLYQVMDLFALPSLWEGMPYAILEAMALGIPVIATDISGNDELVEHTRTGFLIPLGNHEDLAERIKELLSSETLRMKMGEEGRLQSAGRTSIQEWVSHYEKAYVKFAQTAG